jgi:hypothetical protein
MRVSALSPVLVRVLAVFDLALQKSRFSASLRERDFDLSSPFSFFGHGVHSYNNVAYNNMGYNNVAYT